jgi:single-strand DNA-binding protein
MLNKVILVGRIVKDIELRQTQSGVPYTYLTLAVNRPGNNDQTDFIDCVA